MTEIANADHRLASGWAGEDDPAAPEPGPPSPAEPAPTERDLADDLVALAIHNLVELRVDGAGEIRVAASSAACDGWSSPR